MSRSASNVLPMAPVLDLGARDGRMGRPADRQDVIVDSLRQRIVSGDLGIGRPLPTRSQLQKSFEASPVTVQRALERLKKDGFVTATRGAGTFVSEKAPHLSRFGLVFALSKDPEFGWVNFHEALSFAAREISEKGIFDVPEFLEVDGFRDSDGYQAMLEDVREHRVAGLLFISVAMKFRRDPLMFQREIPCAIVATHDWGTGFPMVRLDSASFREKALGKLARLGARKVAVLAPKGMGHERADFLAEIGKQGLETRPYWWQYAPQGDYEAAYQICLLLFNQFNTDRPNAFVILDDNLVEPATQAILDSGAEGVQIIAHANFPVITPSRLPVIRLGYSAKELLTKSMLVMQEQNAGVTPPEQILIPARFEEEIVR